MSGYSDIELEIEDPVGLIRLNRPEKLNALTYHTLGEIRAAIAEAVESPAVVAIVITGEGRGFCSGLDSQTLMEVTSSKGEGRTPVAADEVPGLFSYFLDVPKPIIAAVNGVAAGGGLMLAMCSDIRIASTAASFITVFLKRGLIAEHGSSWILPRLLGSGRALDWLFTSDRIDGQRAHELGLVEHLVEPERLLPFVREHVEKIAVSAAPEVMRDTKRMVYKHLGLSYADALRDAEVVQWQAVARDDAAEGARALLEKRAPKFRRLGSG